MTFPFLFFRLFWHVVAILSPNSVHLNLPNAIPEFCDVLIPCILSSSHDFICWKSSSCRFALWKLTELGKFVPIFFTFFYISVKIRPQTFCLSSSLSSGFRISTSKDTVNEMMPSIHLFSD